MQLRKIELEGEHKNEEDDDRDQEIFQIFQAVRFSWIKCKKAQTSPTPSNTSFQAPQPEKNPPYSSTLQGDLSLFASSLWYIISDR